MAGAGSSPWGVEARPGSSGCLCPAHPLHVVIRPENGWFLIATEPSGPPLPTGLHLRRKPPLSPRWVWVCRAVRVGTNAASRWQPLPRQSWGPEMPSPVFPHSGRQAPGGTPNPKTGSAWGEGQTGSWGARKRWPLGGVGGLRGRLRAAPPSPNSPCGSGFQQRRVQRGFKDSEV